MRVGVEVVRAVAVLGRFCLDKVGRVGRRGHVLVEVGPLEVG